MADQPIDQLLFEYGVDLTPVEQAGQSIQIILNALNKLAEATEQKTKSAGAEQIRQMEASKAVADAAVKAALDSIQNEIKKTAEFKAQRAELEQQTAEIRKNIAAENEKKAAMQAETATLQYQSKLRAEATAELKRQTEEIRRQHAQEDTHAARHEGGESVGSILFGSGARRSVGRALFGSGLGGAVATGVLAGEGATFFAESAVTGIEHFIEKLKEVSVEAGKLYQVEDRLNKLAAGAGTTGDLFVERLRDATDGLVTKFNLAQLGVRALSSGMKELTPDKIVMLTEAVTKLAQSTGRMTADQAIEQLSMAFTRGGGNRLPMIVSRITGISAVALQLADLPPMLNRVERGVESFNHVLAVTISEAAKLGDVPRTIAQAQTQIEIVSKDIFEAFGKGFNASGGAQVLLNTIAAVTKELGSVERAAETMGQKFGDSLAVLSPILTSIKDLLGIVFDLMRDFGVIALETFGFIKTEGQSNVVTIQNIGNAILDLNNFLQISLRTLDAMLRVISSMAPLLQALGTSLAIVAMPSAAGALMPTLIDSLKRTASSETVTAIKAAMAHLQAELPKELADIDVETGRKKAKFDKDVYDQFNRPRTPKPIAPPELDESTRKIDESRLSAQKALDAALLKLEEEKNKLLLAQEKETVDQLKAIDNERYQAGEETMAEHLENQKRLAEQERDNRLKEIGANFEAQRKRFEQEHKEVDAQAKLKGLDATPAGRDVVRLQHEKITAEYTVALEQAKAQSVNATDKFEQETSRIEREGQRDRLAALKTHIQERLQVQLEGIKAEEALTQKQLKGGDITPNEYFDTRIKLIEAAAKAQIDAANEVYEQTKAKSAAAAADLQKTIASTMQIAKDKLDALKESRTDVIEQAIQHEYNPQQKGLEAELSVQRGTRAEGANNVNDIAANLQRLMANMDAQAKAYEALLTDAVARGDIKQGSDEWFRLYQNIEQTRQAQIKFNQELLKLRDIMQPVAAGFGTISQGILENFHSKFAQNLGQVVGAGAKSIQQSTELGIRIRGGQKPVDPVLAQLETQSKALFDGAKSSADKLVTPFGRLATAIDAVIVKLERMANPVGAGAHEPTISEKQSETIDELGVGSGDTGQRTYSGMKVGGGGITGTVTSLTEKFGAAVTAVDNFTQSILNAHSAIGGGAGGAVGGLGLGNTISKAFGMSGPWGAVAGGVIGGTLGAITGAKQAQVTANIHDLEQSYKNIMNEFAQNTNNLQNTIIQLSQLVAQAQAMQASSKKGSAQYQQVIDQYNQEIIQLQTQQHQILVNLQEQLAVINAPLSQQSYLSDIQQIIKQFQQFEGAAQTTTDLANAYQFLTQSVANYITTQNQQLLQSNQQAIQDALQLNDLIYQRTQMTLQYNTAVQGILSQGVLTRTPTRAQTAASQIQQLEAEYNRQMQSITEQIDAAQYRVQAESKIFDIATTRIGLENQLLVLQNAQTTLDMQRISALATLVSALSSGNLSAIPALSDLLSSIPSVTNPTGGVNTLEELFSQAYQDRGAAGYAAFRNANL